MTQIPPVSPDFAAMARAWWAEYGDDRKDKHWYIKMLAAKFESIATLSHAAGRAEGLEEAAQVADTFTCGGCGMDGKAGAAIRALASDPVAPAPAPGLAAQEVERLRAIEMAAQALFNLCEKSVDAKCSLTGVTVEHVLWNGLRVALSAPRPEQAKEGPTS